MSYLIAIVIIVLTVAICCVSNVAWTFITCHLLNLFNMSRPSISLAITSNLKYKYIDSHYHDYAIVARYVQPKNPVWLPWDCRVLSLSPSWNSTSFPWLSLTFGRLFHMILMQGSCFSKIKFLYWLILLFANFTAPYFKACKIVCVVNVGHTIV